MFVTVEPCFAEGHILEAHIRNTCEYLKPDHMIIGEGLFPSGPEDSLRAQRMKEFKRLYTTDGKRSFDIDLMRNIVSRCQNSYPNTQIHWIEMDYPEHWDTRATYEHVYTLPERVLDLQPDDIVLATETDLLFTEWEADNLRTHSEALPHGGSNSVIIKQFFVSPQVMMGMRHRRGAWKWGTGAEYRQHFNIYYNEQVSVRQLRNPLNVGWHYEWTRPPKYYEMRLEQTYKHGVDGIIKDLVKIIDSGDLNKAMDYAKRSYHMRNYSIAPYTLEDHPVHIRNHPNLVRYLSE